MYRDFPRLDTTKQPQTIYTVQEEGGDHHRQAASDRGDDGEARPLRPVQHGVDKLSTFYWTGQAGEVRQLRSHGQGESRTL